MGSTHGYWLLKTEPETYSFDDLVRDRRTRWDGVRNFQARNYLRAMKKGDVALIYHSGKERAVVGIAEVARTAYADPTATEGDWSVVDLVAVRKLRTPVPLSAIKQERALESMSLLRQSRLSVMPITPQHHAALLHLSKERS